MKPYPKSPRKIKLSGLKAKAWKLFSEIIRRRDTDSRGFTACVTCGKRAHWKEMQASHFLDGRHGAVLFNPNGVWPGCVRCNIFLHGNKIKYTLFMQEKFGLAYVEEMIARSHDQVIYSRSDYEQMIKMFTDTLEKLNS